MQPVRKYFSIDLVWWAVIIACCLIQFMLVVLLNPSFVTAQFEPTEEDSFVAIGLFWRCKDTLQDTWASNDSHSSRNGPSDCSSIASLNQCKTSDLFSWNTSGFNVCQARASQQALMFIGILPLLFTTGWISYLHFKKQDLTPMRILSFTWVVILQFVMLIITLGLNYKIVATMNDGPLKTVNGFGSGINILIGWIAFVLDLPMFYVLNQIVKDMKTRVMATQPTDMMGLVYGNPRM